MISYSHRRIGVILVAIGLAASMCALAIGPATAAPATCTLTPQLRDVAITQGVGSYNPLVRGKEALVRAYLSLPSCAARAASIAVTGASLRVTTPSGNTNINPDNLVTNPAPLLAPYASAPAVDSPADTRFVVPGSVLAPSASSDRFTATMRVSITYSAKTSNTATPVTGTINFTTETGSTAPISAVVEKRTNALRVLVVPMGDPTVGYAQQFNSTSQQTTSAAMRSLARTLPVPDGAGDLISPASTAGIRYTVTPTIADVRSFEQSIGGVSKFCGTGTNFDGVAANLSTFLQTWNANNPAIPADRVIGVVQESLSFGAEAGCAEGMAKVGQPITWVRLDSSATAPSITGSTMAMEIAHTFGDVPLNAPNADPFSRYHSVNTQADDSAPNRAYNVPTRQFLATDRTVLAVRDSWNDQTTLLEASDWTFMLCALTPTPRPANCPTSTTTIGTAQNVGNDPTFVISGVIDHGPPTTADITESYFRNGVARFSGDDSSTFRLVQETGAGTVLSNVGIPVNFDTSDHDEEHDPEGPPDTDTVTEEHLATFTAAVPFNTAADRIKLMDGTNVLYTRNRVPAPAITAVTPGGGAGSTERASIADGPPHSPDNQGFGTTYSSDISGDGNLVVFRTRAQLDPIDTNEYSDIYLRNLEAETTRLVTDGIGIETTEPSNGNSFDPVISRDGSTIAFVSAADNLVTDGDSEGSRHVYVYDVEGRYTDIGDVSSNSDIGNNDALGRPVLSHNGRFVAYTSLANNLTYDTSESGYASRVYLTDRWGEGPYTQMVSLPTEDCSDGSPDCTDEGEKPGSITDDGRYVSFLSDTPKVFEFDGTPAVGVFAPYVADTWTGNTRLAVFANTWSDPCNLEGCSAVPAPINGNVVNPPLLSPLSGPDVAKYVVFDSVADNLVPNDNNEAADVFSAQVGSGSVTRLTQQAGTSPITGEGELNGESFLLDVTPDLDCAGENPSCAADILIASNASNWVSNDNNFMQDVFTYDFSTSADIGPTRVTVDSDGFPAVADPYTNDNELTDAYKPGGISDDGKAATFVSTALNLDDGDTNNYADAFVRHAGGGSTPGEGDAYTVTATGENPENLRVDLVFRCGSINYPVAVALQPDSVFGTSATWSINVDASLVGLCPPGSGLVAIANDGFSTSQTFEATVPPTLTSQPPSPAIYGPAPGDAYSTYLQYSTVTLDGTARDAEDGVVPGSGLTWFVTPPGGSESAVGTGNSVRLAPPAGGFAPGVYEVRLRAVDSDGQSNSTLSSFTVLTDEDNDGVPAAEDRSGDTGAGCGAPGSGDHDPTNAYADPDGDGISTIDEIAFSEQPCVAATGTVGTATLVLTPNPVPNSTGNPVTGEIRVSDALETQILPSSLRLTLTATTAGGATVSTTIEVLRSASTATLLTAKFNRQQILNFARQNSLLKRPIEARLTGYVSGAGPFAATTTLVVTKK